MLVGDVADQLLDDDGLAHAGASEEAHLPALGVRLEQVHDLDAGLQHLGLGLLLMQSRRRAMNGQRLLGLDRPFAVDRLAQHVEQTAERLAADRHRDGRAGISDLHPTDQSVGTGHGHGSHPVLAKVLGHLQCEADLRTPGLLVLRRFDSYRVVDLR